MPFLAKLESQDWVILLSETLMKESRMSFNSLQDDRMTGCCRMTGNPRGEVRPSDRRPSNVVEAESRHYHSNKVHKCVYTNISSTSGGHNKQLVANTKSTAIHSCSWEAWRQTDDACVRLLDSIVRCLFSRHVAVCSLCDVMWTVGDVKTSPQLMLLMKVNSVDDSLSHLTHPTDLLSQPP